MNLGPRALARRVGGVVVMLLALGPAVIVTAPAAEAYTPSAATVAAYEARVIYRINVVRAQYHRGRLAAASCPDYYAENWSSYLARTHRFYHRSMYTILRGCRATVAAENLAIGNASADAMVVAWMRSYGHRKNILDGRLTRIGVGAVYTHGYWVVAANFTRP
jgi:uncharacterized protein YkwD